MVGIFSVLSPQMAAKRHGHHLYPLSLLASSTGYTQFATSVETRSHSRLPP